ncbi:MAG TPA: helix-turn-helix domain-containing protein [Caulobacteraceae bacterium]|nr:helix-turn-helix domain-containing protein [Caulobacteraceae bacterium]
MSRREEAKEERRHRIVTAARDLIRETGDAGVSMRAIAGRADVSLSTPYNLFGSKRAIVLAVLEDIREFTERFARLRSANAVERIFQVLSMSIRYYVDDPDFYRALWTGVFDLSGKEVRSALLLPERDAFWLSLVDAAAREGALPKEIDTAMLLRSLDLTYASVMLSWVVGALKTSELEAVAGYGYALTLRGAAALEWQPYLAEKVGRYQKQMLRRRGGVPAI